MSLLGNQIYLHSTELQERKEKSLFKKIMRDYKSEIIGQMPKITSSFNLSVILHLFILIAFLIIGSRSSVFSPAIPYVVTLVDEVSSEKSSAKGEAPSNIVEATKRTDDIKADMKIKTKSPVSDDSIVKESIAALEAKKKIEKMANLRKMIDIGGEQRRGTGNQRTETSSQYVKTHADTGSQGMLTQGAGVDYYSIVIQKIRQQWIFPESLEKDLETVVAIKIARDGSVTIERIERSSGNPLFDRSVLRAINRANPLPPPVRDMEIGVRFRP